MEPRERYLDLEETLRTAFEGLISGTWTALPARVEAVTNGGNTVEVQPAVNGRVRQMDGTFKSIQMPKLVDVPVYWPGGGGVTLTFPITAGVDECLVVFACRCIENWWFQGFTPPKGSIVGADGRPLNPANDAPVFRMHDLSDGFAFVGFRNKARALAAYNATTARVRSDDNATYLEFDMVNKKLTGVFSGGITLNNVTIDSSGNVVSPGTITGQTDVVAKTGGSAVHVSSHKHSGVTTGGSQSGAPVG